MLIYNIDIVDGLVNGVFGIVIKLLYGKFVNVLEVKLVEVCFDNKSVGKWCGIKVNNEIRVFIEWVEEMVGKNRNIVRK